ncbi:MAG TPA: flagellar cap protein [Gammaproteobacteria bacterium]|nr:flagellar cap protein [Gammaproteobacteria bacterium]
MPAITSAGVGSGIDIESLLTNLMEVERAPLNAMNQRKSAISVQISAYGQLKSNMSALEDIVEKLGDSTKFGDYVATSSDEEVFTATTTTGAIAEQHDIEVLSLAQNHRMTSASFADSATEVGTGSYAFSSGDESFSVTIDTANNSLKGLRDAINDSADNTSISASIINVDGGSRLVLTAKEGGTANTITAPAMFSDLTTATDATFEIDGFMTTSSSNTVADVIPGVTLQLKSVGEASVATERDVETIKENLDEFVAAYNTLSTSISALSEGTLSGDSLGRGFLNKIRQEFFSEIALDNGDTLTAFDLGLTFDKEGTLSIDSDTFEEMTTENLESFINAFTDIESGLSTKLEDTLSVYTQAGGFIDNRTDGLDSRSDSIDTQIERLEVRLESIEARYRRQFTVMDQMVAQLQAGSDYLNSQLSSLDN